MMRPARQRSPSTYSDQPAARSRSPYSSSSKPKNSSRLNTPTARAARTE